MCHFPVYTGAPNAKYEAQPQVKGSQSLKPKAFSVLPAGPNIWLVMQTPHSMEQKHTLSGPQHFHNKLPQVKPQSSPKTLQL